MGNCLLAGDIFLGLPELTLAGLRLPDPNRLRLVPEEVGWKLGDPPEKGWGCWSRERVTPTGAVWAPLFESAAATGPPAEHEDKYASN